MSDLSKLSFADLVKQQQEIAALIESKRGEELKVLVDGLVKKGEAAGFTVAELRAELSNYGSKKTASDGATKRASKFQPLPGMTKASQDKDGKSPEPNSKYDLGNGSFYETGEQPKRVPDNVLALIHGGKTWASMRVKK